MDTPSLIIQQIVSKVIVDRTRIPRSAYQKVEPLVDEFKRWTRTFEDFEIDKPETWVRSGMNLVENLVEKDARRTDPIQTFLHEKECENNVPETMNWAGQFLLKKCDLDVLLESGDRRLCKVDLDETIYLTITGDQYEFEDLHLPNNDEKRADCYKVIRDLFWAHNGTVIIDDDEDEFIVKKYIFPNRKYKGEALDEVKSLSKYIDSGIRRVVVLQGVPGTGKSTLCANAAELLSDRTVVLSNTIIPHLSRNDWEEIIKLLRPEMVIIDDIDRTNMRSLETSLYLFEDTYYNVPVTLMTTNDQRKLPDAFRRPGRIDQIISMPLPTKEIRAEIIKEMAEREGIKDIPDKHFELFDDLISEHPVAYLVELLRRYKAMGWEYEVPENDIVFNPIMQKIHDSSTRPHEVLDGGCAGVFEPIGTEGVEGIPELDLSDY